MEDGLGLNSIGGMNKGIKRSKGKGIKGGKGI
jgi:hypothetical protein